MDFKLFDICIPLFIGFMLFRDINGQENSLYNALGLASNTGSYNTDIRPRVNHADKVLVTLDFELQTISDMDEVAQVFTVLGFVMAIWEDDYLKWTPDSYGGIERIVLPASKVWLPDFGIENSATSFYDSSYNDDFHVAVHYTGKVEWGFGGLIALQCNLDLSYYPFDSHDCALEIENFAYDASQVDLTNYTDHIVTTDLQAHGIWKLTKSSVEKKFVQYEINGNLQYPKMLFHMNVKRKANYYSINYIVPTIFMVLISLSMFWLPCESGEKIGLGITVMLTFSVFQLTITAITPSNSEYIPVLTIIFLFCMGVSTLSLLTTIWVMYVNHKVGGRPPRWLRHLMFNIIAKSMCMKDGVPEVEDAGNKVEDASNQKMSMTSVGNQDNAKPKLADGLSGTDKLLQRLLEKGKRQSEEEEHAGEWHAISRVMDRVLFWFFSIVAIIGVVALIIEAIVLG